MLNRNEISDITGFDHGVKFTRRQQVLDYFTVQNMRDMFSGESVASQDELDEMAGLVIANEWHCKFPPNTRTRHEEIYAAAVSALETAGGVVAVDQLDQLERLPVLRKLYKQVTDETNCHIDTAKKNVAKAMRKARYGEMKKSHPELVEGRWGGERPGAGRPKTEEAD